MTRHEIPAVLALGLGLLAFPALAAGPSESEDPAASPWKSVTDLAFVSASGNTETSTFAFAEDLTWKRAPWSFGAHGSVLRAETDSEETAERYRARFFGGYDLSKRLTITGLVGWEKDRFAGIDNRFEETPALVYHAILPSPHKLDLLAGVSFIQQRSLAGPDDDFVAAALGALYVFEFGEKAFFLQGVEVLPSFEDSDDVRINSRTEVVAPLWEMIALKAGYVVRWDNLPEPGFEETDRTFTAGLQITYP